MLKLLTVAIAGYLAIAAPAQTGRYGAGCKGVSLDYVGKPTIRQNPRFPFQSWLSSAYINAASTSPDGD